MLVIYFFGALIGKKRITTTRIHFASCLKQNINAMSVAFIEVALLSRKSGEMCVKKETLTFYRHRNKAESECFYASENLILYC